MQVMKCALPVEFSGKSKLYSRNLKLPVLGNLEFTSTFVEFSYELV
jgi:hypothetical protein